MRIASSFAPLRLPVLLLLLLSSIMAGCGGSPADEDAGTVIDAGPDASRPSPAEAPVEAAAPLPVTVSDRACPEGWLRTDAGCRPFEVEPSCGAGEIAIPGEAACFAIGTPCPAGDFADPPASGEVIYVSATAGGPGDGTVAAPYASLAPALARASVGATILLSKGAHVGAPVLTRDLHLRGACPTGTTLSPPSATTAMPTVLVQSGHVHVSDLTLTGARPGLFAFGASARATLRGLIVDGAAGLGVLAQSGTIDAEEILVRNVTGGGRGVDAAQGGTLDLRRSMLEGLRGGGMLLSSDSQVTISDVLFRDFTSRAVSVQVGADVVLDRVAMLRVGHVALNANNDGTNVTAHDLVIDGVPMGDPGGRGISIGEGARFDAAGIVVANVEENCVFVTDPGSTATIEDAFLGAAGGRGLNAQRSGVMTVSRVRIENILDVSVLASSEAELTVQDATIVGGARALRAQTASSLSVERATVSGNAGDAIQASHEGTTVIVEDLVVEDTVSTGDLVVGRGAAAFSGSRMTIRRASLARTSWSGVSVFGAGTSALVEDATIRDVAPYLDGTAGYGVSVLEGSLEANRVSVERVYTMGVAMGFGARVVARDLVIREIRPEMSTGLWGRAVSSQGPADRLSVERGVFEDSISAGVFAGGEGTTFDLSDIAILRTHRRECGGTACTEEGGVGLLAFGGAAVTVESFVLADNALAGAMLALGGELDFRNGEVRNQPIGVSLQDTGYDVNRLTDGVHYIDNQSNLDVEGLPLPSELAPDLSGEEPPED